MLRGKNAVITGARRGIGRATVEAFAGNGANVWACIRARDEAFESEMAGLSRRCGVWIEPVCFDLTDEGQVKQAVRQIQGKKQPVDILVNNAGALAPVCSFSMLSAETLRQSLEVNFVSQMRLTQYLVRLMMRCRRGSIVNLTSVAALDGEPAQLEYVAGKAAMAGATKKLASELGEYGIRVNAVAPGVIDTDMGNEMQQQLMERILSRTVMKRRGTPEEVANVIAFLASDRSSYMTGQILRVDGGL